MEPTTTTNPTEEVAMSTFTASVLAADADAAVAKAVRYVDKVDGFAVTGRVAVRSERHGLYDVEVANLGGDVNDCWVILTSYGISPGAELGSTWQTVAGVGC